MKTKLILLAFITLFAFGCSKDKLAPTLSISSPSEGAQAQGTIVIKGNVADKNLKSLVINITKDASGASVYNKELSITGLTAYTFEEQYDPGFMFGSAAATLTIDVEDMSGNRTTKRVKFTIAP